MHACLLAVYPYYSFLSVLQHFARAATVYLCNSYVLLLTIHACLLAPQPSTRATAIYPYCSCLPVQQLCAPLSHPCLSTRATVVYSRSSLPMLQLSARATAVYPSLALHAYVLVL